MRKPIIAANWKMHKNRKEAEEFIKNFTPLVEGNKDVDIVVCVPFTVLDRVSDNLNDNVMALGAQNMHPAEKGAYTGEISAEMLLDLGVKYVILGHSERRELFGETDEFIREKVIKALETGLTPILCVGETLAEREQGLTEQKCQKQVEAALKGLEQQQVEKVVIAYEPVWAIGTGKTATPADAEQTIAFIRQVLGEIFTQDTAQVIRIQYGGSVKPNNIQDLMAQPNVDGALVGGASLEAESFAQIVNFKE